MATIIDRSKCTNCKICYERCPEGLFELDENGKVYVARPDECWLCGACQMDCPCGALKVTYDINSKPVFVKVKE